MSAAPRPAAPARPLSPSPPLHERIAVVFLVVAAVALATIRFHLLPARAAVDPPVFDLHNPMLDAQSGDCVRIEAASSPGAVVCMHVAGPGLVLRPGAPGAPQSLGQDRDLSRVQPYLACRLRYPRAGRGCDDPEAEATWDRFPLNGFGMPVSAAGMNVEPVTVEPHWIERGGEHRFVYKVLLRRYGPDGGPWLLHLAPDVAVTGVIYREFVTARGTRDWAILQEVPGGCGEQRGR